MDSNFLDLRSLKTRMTLFTLAIFLIGIWSLAFYIRRDLRENMQCVLSDQQFSTVSILATKINQELDDRLKALEKIAGGIGPDILDNTAALQTYLEQRVLIYSLFNGGVFITGIDGTATASIPLSAKRLAINYMDRDYIVAALKDGKSTIGRTVMGKAMNSPVFVVAAPIRDVRSKVIGAIAGVTDLGKPNFLSNIMVGRYGKTGGYVLIEPQSRMIITATDKTRIMTLLPKPGINPMLDRYMQGYEGSGIVVDSRGLEVSSSAKQIPVAGWLLVARVPTEEAFSPIRTMQQRILLIAICMSLVVCGLTWWMLRRLLFPMLAAMTMLSALSDSDQPPQPLPITSQDEIGELIKGFNRLLETLAKREEALRASEEKHRSLFESANDGIFIHDMQAKIMDVNPIACELLGYTKAEMMTMTIGQVDIPEEAKHIPDRIARLLKQGHINFETVHQRKNGSRIPIDVSTRLITWDGQPVVMSICRDITERKQADEQKDKLVLELQKALSEVKTLSGLLPICSYCKKIRDDKGYWNHIEAYIRDHSETTFSHGICQECAKKHFPDMDLYDK